jgi:3-deoxy-D-manno-octulosonic-acid transferase
LVDAYVSLAPSFPGLRLLIAPRHLERLEEIEELIRRRNLSFVTRTGRRHDSEQREIPPVLILDTTGELARTYALAEIAFIGKSLTATGGQNPLEPAGLGVPVCFGPRMENFRSIAPLLVDGGGARVVERTEDVEPTLRELLGNPNLIREMGKKAQGIVEKGSGAAIRTATALVPLIQPE